MIRLFALATCAALLGASAPAPADGGLQGDWRNTKNTVHLRVEPCGQALCGTVTWAADQQRADARKGSGKDLIGSALLRDLRRGGDGKWRGKIYIPDIDTTASATVTQINDDQILVSGCTFLGVICRSQHWHRI
ncbi:DUF2147 domain-containing protein [Sphingomonas sp. LB-2]|uniref:DUF2147 domain-containing protein n=1 Tax=Sphingomonas caeni TaxID=2984949 RepID=UPI002231EE45|nr:DUF2147 domain-containing protein [Sphingomonas caeni]MCW3846204.1 DUF2147 domain-containing protein [Sphingomonas caeni]